MPKKRKNKCSECNLPKCTIRTHCFKCGHHHNKETPCTFPSLKQPTIISALINHQLGNEKVCPVAKTTPAPSLKPVLNKQADFKNAKHLGASGVTSAKKTKRHSSKPSNDFFKNRKKNLSPKNLKSKGSRFSLFEHEASDSDSDDDDYPCITSVEKQVEEKVNDRSDSNNEAVINHDLPHDDPSNRTFIENVGNFRNNELDFASMHDQVNDNILQCYAKHLINESTNPDAFLYIEPSIVCDFDGFYPEYDFTWLLSGITNQNIWFIPNNAQSIHWQLLVVVNALEDNMDTEIFFLDSSEVNFDPRKKRHRSLATGKTTLEWESAFLNKFLRCLLHSVNPSKKVPLFRRIPCVQQLGNNCGLHMLKNMKCFIDHWELLLSNPLDDYFLNGAKHWFSKKDATDLRATMMTFF